MKLRLTALKEACVLVLQYLHHASQSVNHHHEILKSYTLTVFESMLPGISTPERLGLSFLITCVYILLYTAFSSKHGPPPE